MVHPKVQEIVAPGRVLVKEGPLMCLDETTRRKKMRYLFLFNDILLITKKEGPRRFWIRILANLRGPGVHTESFGEWSDFRLMCPKRNFLFSPANHEERDEWKAAIDSSITGKKVIPEEQKAKKYEQEHYSDKPQSNYEEEFPDPRATNKEVEDLSDRLAEGTLIDFGGTADAPVQGSSFQASAPADDFNPFRSPPSVRTQPQPTDPFAHVSSPPLTHGKYNPFLDTPTQTNPKGDFFFDPE
eukprot:TRINITY_DN366_c0_g4_i1.p1 TRINITY_DN366_c0_g4~~TRINITY_DN366_c0_g4_i1.p1  ORF type:complete len:266 (-),score=49.15 TRINITY_DN366_c0_g4_i1:46-771(-)